ncbi:CHS7 Chitin synthase export chaperone [Candida maltosa Xu316]|uniref:Chitin synthase export chaperone n=1 Tax=Candida maltosa (strain Xu316) TaxID=1245528 RepID=M3HE37_CANMX|nr:Chitin synthase export chaperone [Candida maltosa Xu316]
MSFGSFDDICNKTALPLCSVVGAVNQTAFFQRGIVPDCYARSVELANTMIFQIGNAFVHFGGLLILLIIIFNVRSKYTAIGRKEMLFFLYLLIGLIVSSLIVDCGVSPPSSLSYAYFVAVQIGLASSVCACLLYNGFLYFQFWEDGTSRSMWCLRLVCVLWFVVNFVVAIITFKSWNTALDFRKTTALFTVSYVLNAIILATYVVSQIVLSVFALRNIWSLGAILLGVFFFVAGQVLTYVFSNQICRGASHYVDGLFFGSACNVFTFMMIYKFWDMITNDDLEFSVANAEQQVSEFGLEKSY